MKIALIFKPNQRVALGERCLNVLKTYKRLELAQFDLEEIQEVKPIFDLYFRIDDGDYTIDIPELHPCCWWISDTHLPKAYKKIKEKIKKYDYIFCMQKEGAERLYKETGKECYWVPWAVDEISEDFKFLSDKERIWDICFIGTDGKHSLRKVGLEILKMNYPNSYFGRIHYTELLNYYSKARIVVNYPINNDINARMFESMGAGALLINHKIKNNGFNELFKENEHLVLFEDITKELKEKVDYYLKNKEEREKIAYDGFQYVKNNHTYRHRLIQIFKIIGLNLEDFYENKNLSYF